MKFGAFDKEMREFEKSLDQFIPENTWMVARLDGRGFTKLTTKDHRFAKPFDIIFGELMTRVTKTLMTSGFEVIYGYTQSDEISLLFKKNTDVFNRSVRKYNSTLAGVASAAMSITLKEIVTFDCRMIPLPDLATVKDYFRWRQEDAARNALNGYCYWTIRKEGKSGKAADTILKGTDYEFKTKFLKEHQIEYDEVPAWQKNGTGIWFEQKEVERETPTGEIVKVDRNILTVEENLPVGKEYAELIEKIIGSDSVVEEIKAFN